MKLFLILQLIASFTWISAGEIPSLESILKKIEKPDINFLSAVKDFQKTTLEFNNNKDQTKEISLLMKSMESTFCLNSFSENVDQAVFGEVMMALSSESKPDEERMSKIMSDPVALQKHLLPLMKMQSQPRSACHFAINENTDAILKAKLEAAKNQAELDKILTSKKNVHPVFQKLITDLEAKKLFLVAGLFYGDDIKLEPQQYERNFVTVYDYQTKLLENFSRNKLVVMPSNCLNSVKTLFISACKTNIKYTQIKGPFTQILLCSDDHVAKIEPKCGYKVSFRSK